MTDRPGAIERSHSDPSTMPRHELSPADVAAIVRRRLPVAALTFVAVLAAVVGFAFTREPPYEARAIVTLRTPRNEQLFPAAEGDTTSLTRRAEDEITSLRPDAAGAAFPDDDGVVVTAQGVLAGSPFATELVFTATGPDRERVIENANRWATTYVSMRSEALIADNDALITTLEDQRADLIIERDELAEPLAALDAELALAADADETLRLIARRSAVERSIGSELEALRQRGIELDLQIADRQAVRRNLELAGVSARVDRLADRASQPSGDPTRTLALGSVMAITASVAAAALSESFDPKVRTGPLTGLAATVRVIGHLRPDRSNAGTAAECAQQDLDRLFANLALSLPAPPGSIVVVTSPSDDGRAGSLAARLALAIAANGFTTLALDTTSTRPGLYGRLGLADLDGVPSDFGAAPIGTHHPNLCVLPASSPDTPALRMSANGAIRLVVDAAGRHDVTVIDAPPLIGERTDTLLLAGSAADVVLLVVVPGTTRRRDLDTAIDRLRFAGVDQVGLVIDETTARAVG